MFDHLTSARRSLRQFNEGLDPATLNPLEAKAAVESLARIEKQAAGARLRVLRAMAADEATVDWLAKETGQSKREAQRLAAAAFLKARGVDV